MKRRIWTGGLKKVGVLLLLGALFMATAAPGGGGRGGGGGGRGGGGFGGGGFRGGGFRGGGGYGFGYGGSRGTGNGNSDPRTTAFLLLVTVAAGAGVAAMVGVQIRPQVVYLGLLLRDAEEYLPELDRILTRGNFRNSATRSRVLRRLGLAIRPEDVVGGFVRSYGHGGSLDEAGAGAEQLHLRAMAAAGIDADSLGAGRRKRATGGWCVVGLTLAVSQAGDLPEGGVASARSALQVFRDAAPVTGGVFLHYAPDPGRTLDQEQARELLRTLRRA